MRSRLIEERPEPRQSRITVKFSRNDVRVLKPRETKAPLANQLRQIDAWSGRHCSDLYLFAMVEMNPGDPGGFDARLGGVADKSSRKTMLFVPELRFSDLANVEYNERLFGPWRRRGRSHTPIQNPVRPLPMHAVDAVAHLPEPAIRQRRAILGDKPDRFQLMHPRLVLFDQGAETGTYGLSARRYGLNCPWRPQRRWPQHRRR